MRFNGSAFYVDISRTADDDLRPQHHQSVLLGQCGRCADLWHGGQFHDRAAKRAGSDRFGAFSFLDTKITKVLIPTNDVKVGEPLAYAPSFQGNLRARYEWEIGDG